MNTKEIIESGFFKEFMSEYCNFYSHTFYPEKDLINDILSNKDDEKESSIEKEILDLKKEIQLKNNYDILFYFINTSKPEHPDYIKDSDERFDFIITRSSETFCSTLLSLTPFTDYYNDLFRAYKDEFENEKKIKDIFMNIHGNNLPKGFDLLQIMNSENLLITMIICEIENKLIDDDECWYFDLNEYKKYRDISIPIASLFDYCELIVCLTRLDELQSRTSTNPSKLESNNHYMDQIWFKVGLKFATGEIDTLKLQYNSAKKIAEYLGNKNYDKYILATMHNYQETNRDKNIYAHPDKLLKIYNCCKTNNIEMTTNFIERISLK